MNNLTKTQMIEEKFIWLGRSTTKANYSNSDVSISRVLWSSTNKNNSKVWAYSFTFRNGTDVKFGKSIQIAIYKNRIFIRPSDSKGLSLVKKATAVTPNAYARIKEEEATKELKTFIGDYELKYDDFYELYYIEREA